MTPTPAEIKTVIAQIITKESGFTVIPDDEPLKSIGIDSLSTIEIVMSIEDTYNIEIQLDDVGKGRFTIDSLVDIVVAKIGSVVSE